MIKLTSAVVNSLAESTLAGLRILFLPDKGYAHEIYFEGVLLCTYIVSMKFQAKVPTYDSDFASKLYVKIFGYAIQWGVDKKLSEDIGDFAEKRFILYHKCFKMLNSQTLMNVALGKIGYNLYVKPLQKNDMNNLDDIENDVIAPQEILTLTARNVSDLNGFLNCQLDNIITDFNIHE